MADFPSEENIVLSTFPAHFLLNWSKGGFPFNGKCRAIDFLRLLSFQMCLLICILLLQFKREQKISITRYFSLNGNAIQLQSQKRG